MMMRLTQRREQEESRKGIKEILILQNVRPIEAVSSGIAVSRSPQVELHISRILPVETMSTVICVTPSYPSVNAVPPCPCPRGIQYPKRRCREHLRPLHSHSHDPLLCLEPLTCAVPSLLQTRQCPLRPSPCRRPHLLPWPSWFERCA